MQSFEIIDAPDQEFSVQMENRRVTMRLRYLPAIERWIVDLSRDDEPVLEGRKLVVGRDILSAFDLGIGGLFVWPEREGAAPDYDGLVGGSVTFMHASKVDIASVA